MNNSKNECNLNIRIERELKDQFLNICKEKRFNGSYVIRKFMSDFVEKNGDVDLLQDELNDHQKKGFFSRLFK